MRPIRKYLFIAAVILQCGVLLSMIARQEMLLHSGKKITLRCVPVDPRSLFSGDYVMLNYEISELQNIKDSGRENAYKENDTIYVALVKKQEDGFYSAAETSRSLAPLKDRYQVIIKGTVESSYLTIRVRYGLESYFVPQNEGKSIESNMADVSAEVAVAEDGRSAMSRLFISGKEIRFY